MKYERKNDQLLLCQYVKDTEFQDQLDFLRGLISNQPSNSLNPLDNDKLQLFEKQFHQRMDDMEKMLGQLG